MFLAVNIRSHVNHDANGFYLVSLADHASVSVYDLASFFEVRANEVEIMRVFPDLSCDDPSFSWSTVSVTSDEIFFS